MIASPYDFLILTIDAICTIRAIGSTLGDGRILLLLYLTLLTDNSFLLPFPELRLLAHGGKEVMCFKVFRVILANSCLLHLHIFLR